jgi:hypothetical protein
MNWGTLKWGQVLPRVVHDHLRIHAGPGQGDDHHADLLAHHVVGHPDDRDLTHPGGADQGVLHLDAVDVLAAPVDHVLDPVKHVDQAFGADAAHIPGVQPAFGEPLRRGLGVVPVAVADALPSDQDLARAGPGVDRDLGVRRGPGRGPDTVTQHLQQ